MENPYGVSPQRSPHGPKYSSDVRTDSSDKQRLSAMERLKPGYPPPNGNLEHRGYHPHPHPEGSSNGSLDRGGSGGGGGGKYGADVPQEKGRRKGGYMVPPGENTYYAYRVEQPYGGVPPEMEKRIVEGKVRYRTSSVLVAIFVVT